MTPVSGSTRESARLLGPVRAVTFSHNGFTDASSPEFSLPDSLAGGFLSAVCFRVHSQRRAAPGRAPSTGAERRPPVRSALSVSCRPGSRALATTLCLTLPPARTFSANTLTRSSVIPRLRDPCGREHALFSQTSSDGRCLPTFDVVNRTSVLGDACSQVYRAHAMEPDD